MPKKFRGESSHVTKAKERKSAQIKAKEEKEAAKLAQLEAVEWKKGANLRAAQKAEEAERKRKEKAEVALLKQQLEEQEALELSRMKKGKGSKTAKKRQKAVEEDAVVAAFEQLEVIDATGVDAALLALGADNEKKRLEKHPEKRMKSAYAEYTERMLPQLKEEYPSLRQSQLKNKLYKLWKKSPDNPMNQEHAAYNEKV